MRSTPLLQERGSEDDSGDDDEENEDSLRNRSARIDSSDSGSRCADHGAPRGTGEADSWSENGRMRSSRDEPERRRSTNDAPAAKTGIERDSSLGPSIAQNSSPAAGSPRAPPLRGPQDYRSEGEQPSTARDGRPLTPPRLMQQDSFRAARMPKRGGRKRLRRGARPVIRRKIRVSSYCVARELQTLQLLRWLETQPNRRLSQSLRAQGGTVPPGPVGSITTMRVARTDGLGVYPEGRRERGGVAARVEPALAGVVEAGRAGVSDNMGNGSRSSNTNTTNRGGSVGASNIDRVEWMDSLYIDVIHSTTDLRGGLRKARDLARPAWGGDEVNGRAHEGSPRSIYYYYDGDDDDSRGRSGGGGGEDEDDDDSLTHKDVIFFPYGAVVFWGCSEAEVRGTRFPRR